MSARHAIRVTATIYRAIDDIGDEEQDDLVIDAVCEVTPIVPAQISGPPELCYPAEGGDVEFVTVTPAVELSAGEVALIEEQARALAFGSAW